MRATSAAVVAIAIEIAIHREVGEVILVRRGRGSGGNAS
jgi:hypothetical protein